MVGFIAVAVLASACPETSTGAPVMPPTSIGSSEAAALVGQLVERRSAPGAEEHSDDIIWTLDTGTEGSHEVISILREVPVTCADGGTPRPIAVSSLPLPVRLEIAGFNDSSPPQHRVTRVVQRDC